MLPELDLSWLDVLSSAPIGTAILDQELRYVQINEALARINGPAASDHIGKSIFEVIPDLAAVLGDRLREVLRTGVPILNWEFEGFLASDQRIHHFLASYYPLKSNAGTIAAIAAMVLDISDWKRTEKALKNTVEGLKQERELRERFVSALSHDLRTPLTAAATSAELIRKSDSHSPQIRHLAQRIIANLGRADQMITNLLDVNRIKAGRPIDLRVSEFDVSSEIHAILADMNLIHGNRFTLDAKGGILGAWDRDALKRVLENLLTNAVKYGDPGAPITVRIHAHQERVAISVHNWGQPIPQEIRETLFQPFARATDARTRKAGGWGIGLALVRGLVEAHGGHVDYSSTMENGTCFEISLPWMTRTVEVAS